MLNLLRLLLPVAGIVLAGAPAPAASKLDEYRAAAVDLGIQSLRGVELTGKLVEQQARAAENAKKVFGSGTVPRLETEHFLIYGKVPGRSLPEVGASLERQFALARKALKMGQEDPWPGKLAVYFFTQRGRFASFIRGVEKRRPESDDRGSFQVRSDFPHIAAGPPAEDGGAGPGLEVQMAEELGAALLTLKAGKSVPDWIIAGFGRATYYRASPREYAAERRRVLAALRSTKASAMDVWNGTVKGTEGARLRGSLVDFLAFGPGRAKFVAILEGYKPDEGAATKTTEDAFKAAGVDAATVNRKWKAWARTGK